MNHLNHIQCTFGDFFIQKINKFPVGYIYIDIVFQIQAFFNLYFYNSVNNNFFNTFDGILNWIT